MNILSKPQEVMLRNLQYLLEEYLSLSAISNNFPGHTMREEGRESDQMPGDSNTHMESEVN